MIDGTKWANATLDAKGLRVVIVAANWHLEFVDKMITCAMNEAKRCGVNNVTVERVDGSGELPCAAQLLARSGKFDAIVAIGVIMRGGTPHFNTVLQRATDGLLRVSLDEGVPIGDCVLAVYDSSQIKARIGGVDSDEDKGAGAMHAALSLALLRKKYA